MSTLAQDLRAAKALIDSTEKWTQKVYARDAQGIPVEDWSQRATCFCSIGAVWRSVLKPSRDGSPDYVFGKAGKMIDALSQVVDENRIIHFNDSHTHAEVMEVWDKAIALAEVQS